MSSLPFDHALKEQVILNRAFDDDLSTLKVSLIAGLVIPVWDSLTKSSTTLTDVYSYSNEGTLVATVTVTYTDSDKETLSSVVKT